MLTAVTRRILQIRQLAVESGDASMVRECEEALTRHGVTRDDYDPATVTVDEVATTTRPTRARRRTTA